MKTMTNQEALESLYMKIPELRDCKTIALPRHYFEKLTDVEFIVLYTLPATLGVRVTPRTLEYIEARRKQLGLNQAYIKRVK